MKLHLSKIIFIAFALVLAGCEKKMEEQQSGDHPEGTLNDGKAALVLTQQQLGHIEFAAEAAEIKAVTVPLSLPGRVALNERTTAHITARVTGRVEKVHRVAGDRAKRGEAVVELFSQDFLAMQSEFVQAEERLKRMTVDQPEYGTSKAIYESSRNKLQTVGLTNDEIDHLADTHAPLAFLPVRAPFDGTLLSGEVRLGEFVEMGKEFFTIANLQKLWVIADVFEHDLPLISEGLRGEVTVSPYPTEKFPAMLSTIYDMVDEKSRTVKTRFEVDNRAGKLKPEMFATVNVEAKFGGSSLKIPSSAVMSDNNEAFVFVAVTDTTFEQRAIKIGFETKAYTEVLAGLAPGERVVTKGTFYLKSEMAKETFVEEE